MCENKEVGSKLIWVNMKVDYKRWVIIATFAPGQEKKDRGSFLGSNQVSVSGSNAKDWVSEIYDLKAKVSTVSVKGITWGHGVFSEMNGSGKWTVELCAGKGQVIGNIWFKKRDIHTYMWNKKFDM